MRSIILLNVASAFVSLKRHHKKLIKTESHAKCDLVNVFWYDGNLMITALEIYPTKVGRPLKLIKKILNP